MQNAPLPPQCPPPPRAFKTLRTVDPVTKEPREFVVGAELDFKDVTDEVFRVFVFPNGQLVRVDSPAFIMTKAPPAGVQGGGSLRIITLGGLVHYIPYGWIELKWLPRPGRPHVVF